MPKTHKNTQECNALTSGIYTETVSNRRSDKQTTVADKIHAISQQTNK